MKVTRLGRTRPVINLSSLIDAGDGTGINPPSGSVPTSNGSNGVAWGSNVALITVNGTTKVLGPFVNIANGSNTTVTVDQVGAVASNTIRIHATAAAASFGSNATRVAETSSAGASADSARHDHRHDGIGTITASSSNTMQRGTWNVRAGDGIALALSDADGDGEFDTTTIVNTRAAGSGGGGSSTADAVRNQIGNGEIVIPGLAGSSDIRVAGASDDEFDSTDTSDPMTGWTTLGSPTAHDINSTVKSHYYGNAAAAALGLHGIYKNAPSTPFTVTAKFSDHHVVGGNARAQLAILESGAGKILSGGYAGNNSLPNFIVVDLWDSRTSYNSTPGGVSSVSLPVRYFRFVVASTSSVQFQISPDGKCWFDYGSNVNFGVSIGAVGIVYEAHTSGRAAEVVVDYVRLT